MSTAGSAGPPPDFPFVAGDRVAVRALSPTGEAWFAGTLVATGSGGVRVESAGGDTMWAQWSGLMIRSVPDEEWDAQLAASYDEGRDS